jgi:uncharacterized protein
MIIGVITIELFLPVPQSLKEKRFFLKSIIERLRKKFNISVSEIDHHDLWQRALLGISTVGMEKRYLNKVLDTIIDFVEHENAVQILDYTIEFL